MESIALMLQKTDTVSMRRVIAIFCFLCCVVTVAAHDRSSIDWNVSVSAVSYGSESIKEASQKVTSGSYTRMILSGAVGTSLKLDDNLFAAVSFTPVADFYSGERGELIILDWCGNAGFRVYPGMGGLNFGVEYSLGTRQDIVRLGAEQSNVFTPFGNGFRCIGEYDFSSHTNGFAPLVGLSWRHMPRGNSESDNIFSLYLSFQFN